MKRLSAPSLLKSLLLLVFLLSAQLPGTRAQTPPPAPFPGQAQVLNSYGWEASALPKLNEQAPGVVVTLTPDKQLKIAHTDPRGCSLSVLVISHPPVTQDLYALQGQISFQDVSGIGYLEMWNNFPGGRAYFSRTLAEDTRLPMGRISGTSPGFRPVTLPFNAPAATPARSR